MHVRRLLPVALVLLVPAELAAAYAREDGATAGVIATVLLSLIGYTWVQAALYSALDRPTRSPAKPYGAIVDRVPALVLLSLMVFIPLAVAFLLLIVPGLLLSARWSAAGPLLVLDRLGPIASLERSNDLVRGRTWSVVGAGVVVTLLAIVLGIPGLAITALAESAWADALGEALFDVALFIPLGVFTFAVYRQAQDR
jgi:hypothetical protein